LRHLALPADVPKTGVLILKSVGSLNAAPTLQPIQRDIDFARRMLAQRPRTLAEVSAILGPGEGLDKAANILKLPRNFMGSCRSFCPMAKVCQNLAVAEGHPASVSNNLADLIGHVEQTELFSGAALRQRRIDRLCSVSDAAPLGAGASVVVAALGPVLVDWGDPKPHTGPVHPEDAERRLFV
jgi:hypothetical protein